MYSYEWDVSTGGILLNTTPLAFSKEPRPVYYEELDILGFDQYWNYEKNDSYPYMWAESNNYYYRGRLVAKTRGGAIYTKPEIILVDEPEKNGAPLRFVDVPAMVEKNRDILGNLCQETIREIYNAYKEYEKKVDIFYVAFSGGKDSVVVLDLVQRALPHNMFKVLFGDTGMEFPDTYDVVSRVKMQCEENGIQFESAQSKLSTDQTWNNFGPPATTNRWCCSVHKTSPQINAIRMMLGKHNFTGMAFTGVRGDESVNRSKYKKISYGEKHQGQYSCHPILEWNSAELFLYIYTYELVMNKTYIKGNSRAGCLVCPMSSGKHEYMKHVCYTNEMDNFLAKIKDTSGKTHYTDNEMRDFINEGFWKNRRSGRELNFGQDQFIVSSTKNNMEIVVFRTNFEWETWAKTIGSFNKVNERLYTIEFKGMLYKIEVEFENDNTIFNIACGTSKNDVRFASLFRSVIVKSLYCISCGVCVAECKNNCIDMSSGVKISDNCVHCHKCHDIHEHCLRYNSIRNKVGGEKKMKGLDRYFSFGIRKEWMIIFDKYKGEEEFWITDGDQIVANKKKDAFLNFVKDADMVFYDKKLAGDKYTKYVPTEFAKKMFEIGFENTTAWGMILVNLVYTPEFNWFVKNIDFNQSYTPDYIKTMLEEVMENDSKGLGKRNIVDAFKIILTKTPIGTEVGLATCDYAEKVSISGKETITLNSLMRSKWTNPEPLVILYSLYKFAEACGDYYQFTLSRLMNFDIDSEGVSPAQIFGLSRDDMETILNGLAVNYPEFISVSFNLDLDNVTLRNEKTAMDVLALF